MDRTILKNANLFRAKSAESEPDVAARRRVRTARIAAVFLYATLIVDLYRKFSRNVFSLPVSAAMMRNIIYLALFALLLLQIREKRDFLELGVISVVFIAFVGVSYYLNYRSGVWDLYEEVILMFFSRLLPAYYLGRHLEDFDAFVDTIAFLQFFSLAYVLLILWKPEVSESSYMTISNNLVVVSLIPLFSNQRGINKLIHVGISLMGFYVIIAHGGRGSLVSALLALMLVVLFLNRENGSKRMLLILGGFLLVILFVLFYDQILGFLSNLNPNSRTLKLLRKGDFLWTSNRDSYYRNALTAIEENPFKVYGFLGDRLYYADRGGAGNNLARAFTMFSHNVSLELLLTLGTPVGLLANVFYGVNLIRAYRLVYLFGKNTERITYFIIFGTTIIVMMASSSYLNDYSIWFMVGLAFNLIAKYKDRSQSGVNNEKSV